MRYTTRFLAAPVPCITVATALAFAATPVHAGPISTIPVDFDPDVSATYLLGNLYTQGGLSFHNFAGRSGDLVWFDFDDSRSNVELSWDAESHTTRIAGHAVATTGSYAGRVAEFEVVYDTGFTRDGDSLQYRSQSAGQNHGSFTWYDQNGDAQVIDLEDRPYTTAYESNVLHITRSYSTPWRVAGWLQSAGDEHLGSPSIYGDFRRRVEPIPEPATLALLGLGLVGMLGRRVRRRGRDGGRQPTD